MPKSRKAWPCVFAIPVILDTPSGGFRPALAFRVRLIASGQLQTSGNFVGSVQVTVFEKILDRRIQAWSERVGLLSDLQGGFWAGRGTVDQLSILNEITAIRRENSSATFLCFIDVSKAYDKVSGPLAQIAWVWDVRTLLWRHPCNVQSGATFAPHQWPAYWGVWDGGWCATE